MMTSLLPFLLAANILKMDHHVKVPSYFPQVPYLKVEILLCFPSILSMQSAQF